MDQIALGGMEKDKELKELDTALFSRAPPEAMQATLDHIERQFGGIDAYLDNIGFTRENRERLARSLSYSNGSEAKG